MKKLLFLSVPLIIAASIEGSFGQAFTGTYDFSALTTTSGQTDPTTPPSATGVTFGSFTSAGLSPNPNANSRFSYTTNALGGVNASDNFALFTGSLNPSKYFEVTLSPGAGINLDLDTIAFTIQRSGTGIRSYAVRSSLDSFGANLSASISPANGALGVGPGDEFRYLLDANTTLQNGSLVTLGTAFDALTAPVTFRFYGWNAELEPGTFSIDNVNFGGTTTVVPEPSTMAFTILGVGLLGMTKFRRKS